MVTDDRPVLQMKWSVTVDMTKDRAGVEVQKGARWPCWCSEALEETIHFRQGRSQGTVERLAVWDACADRCFGPVFGGSPLNRVRNQPGALSPRLHAPETSDPRTTAIRADGSIPLASPQGPCAR